MARRSVTAAFFLFLLMQLPLYSQMMNGFQLSPSLIDINEIYRGGPPRDGIPAISNPRFLPANEVDYLKDDDIVIGLKREGIARAYPTRILIWHEIVNDVIEDEPVAVVYCPLCGTAMVFGRLIDGLTREFGVSGLLYRSDVLMYDRETESLWSQLDMRAVSGPDRGQELVWLSSEYMTFKAWKEKYPRGEVLSTDTGFSRNYGGEAYASYFASDRTMFPVPHLRDELSNKSLVIGVILGGIPKAYSLEDLPPGQTIRDSVGGNELVVSYDPEKKYPRVMDDGGGDIPFVVSFWFAWQAFYPQTEFWDG